MKVPERQIVVIPGIQMGKLKICRNIGVFGRFFALQIGHAAFLAQRIESELMQKQTLSDGRQAAFGVDVYKRQTEETSASMTELSGIVTDCNAQTKNLVDIAENLSDNVNQFRIKE